MQRIQPTKRVLARVLASELAEVQSATGEATVLTTPAGQRKDITNVSADVNNDDV